MDFYFVMDFTNTMRDDKEDLQEASEQIAREIKKLTPDFNVGFGSFSDKVMVPFAREKSQYNNHSVTVCTVKYTDGRCHQWSPLPLPYSFRHHLNLTYDIGKFQDIIEKIDT